MNSILVYNVFSILVDLSHQYVENNAICIEVYGSAIGSLPKKDTHLLVFDEKGLYCGKAIYQEHLTVKRNGRHEYGYIVHSNTPILKGYLLHSDLTETLRMQHAGLKLVLNPL